MAAFEYEALDTGGRRKKGVITADTMRLARKELRARKLVPVRLNESSRQRSEPTGAVSGLKLPSFNRGLAARDLALVTRQLATLINASAPVEEALQAIALQAEKPGVRNTLFSVRSGVMEGLRLSQAMAQQPHVFSPLFRSMVAAGEGSGTLGPVLERLADHLENGQKMRAKVTAALVYPSLLAVTAIGVVAMLMAFVVPKVVDQFDSLGRELPSLTKVIIAISDGVRDFGPFVLGALVLGVLVIARGLRNPAFRKRVDHMVLSIPVIGKLIRELHAARLARTMAALVSSGTPVLEGLNAARNTVRNTVMQEAIADASMQVSEGTSLSAALRRTKAFPPLVVYMAAMGEKSGTLDSMLTKAADYLEAEFEALTSAALSMLEPAIIIIMGFVVGTIVMAILLPMLQFNSAVLN